MKAKDLKLDNYVYFTDGVSNVYKKVDTRMLAFIVNSERLGQTTPFIPIPLTEEILAKIPDAIPNPINIIIESWQIYIGRRRRLSVTVENGNQYVYLEEFDEKDYRKIVDLICIFNGDYDGILMLHTFQNMYSLLAGEELEINLIQHTVGQAK